MEENQLIRTILNGDAQAYAVLVRRYQGPIYNLLLRMTGNRDHAADLAQETFVKAYERLAQFRVTHAFFPWLYTIGANLARDWLRKQKHAQAYQALESEESWHPLENPQALEQTIAEKIDLEHVRLCLMQLPEEYREALILRFHEELPMHEVGKALGITTSGAKMRITRGLEKLRGYFFSPRSSRQKDDVSIAGNGKKYE